MSKPFPGGVNDPFPNMVQIRQRDFFNLLQNSGIGLKQDVRYITKAESQWSYQLLHYFYDEESQSGFGFRKKPAGPDDDDFFEFHA